MKHGDGATKLKNCKQGWCLVFQIMFVINADIDILSSIVLVYSKSRNVVAAMACWIFQQCISYAVTRIINDVSVKMTGNALSALCSIGWSQRFGARKKQTLIVTIFSWNRWGYYGIFITCILLTRKLLHKARERRRWIFCHCRLLFKEYHDVCKDYRIINHLFSLASISSVPEKCRNGVSDFWFVAHQTFFFFSFALQWACQTVLPIPSDQYLPWNVISPTFS